MKKKKRTANAFTMELASDLYADTKEGYNGNLTNKHSGFEAIIGARQILENMEMEAKIKKD